MKKILSVILSLLMILSVLIAAPVTASAETSGVFEYRMLEDGTAEITKCHVSEEATTVEIPAVLDGKTVTSIDGSGYLMSGFTNVFGGENNTIQKIILPNTLTQIKDGAFEMLRSLTEINLPDSLQVLGWDTFAFCSSLETIKVPGSVDKLENCFVYCSSLKNVELSEGIKEIGFGCFAFCTGLEEIEFPNSLERISHENPNAWPVFHNCTSLTSVTIPNSVTSIGGSAFLGCTSLSNISVDSKNSAYCSIDGNLYNKDASVLIQYAIGKTAGSFTIPDSVTSIGYRAFEDCTSLTSVTIPDSVTSIGYRAFFGCTSLESVTIPDSVTSIDWSTFSGCSSLTSITIPDSVTSIGGLAFSGCTGLTSVTILGSVTKFGDEVFGYYDDEVSELIIYGYKDTDAERYAEDHGFTFIPLNDIIDTSTEIVISVPEDITVSIKKETEQAPAVLPDGSEVESAYDITLMKDGEAVQPGSAVQVKIPCDNPAAKVYRQEENGTFTDMNAKYKEGHLVFYTDHFSRYLVTTGAKAELLYLGDVDGDGKVTIVDVTCIQKSLASIEVPVYIEEAADVDGDGKVTIVDATFIQKFLASMTAPEGIGQPIV